jgi:hypothetical protein
VIDDAVRSRASRLRAGAGQHELSLQEPFDSAQFGGDLANPQGRRLGIYKPHEEGAKRHGRKSEARNSGSNFAVGRCLRRTPRTNRTAAMSAQGCPASSSRRAWHRRRTAGGRSPIVPQQGLEVVRSEMDPVAHGSIPDRASVSDGAGLGATILRAQRPEGGNPIPSHWPPGARSMPSARSRGRLAPGTSDRAEVIAVAHFSGPGVIPGPAL